MTILIMFHGVAQRDQTEVRAPPGRCHRLLEYVIFSAAPRQALRDPLISPVRATAGSLAPTDGAKPTGSKW